ncbi:hypothetical protein RCS94_06380 [Orbaceae bacterium ac157xtp]
MKTTSILLNEKTWDIELDDKGNIATVDNALSTAQNVACAVSTFLGESYADSSVGVDYDFLNSKNIQYLSFLYTKEAKRIRLVKDAKSLLYFNANGMKERKLSGVITIIDEDNNNLTLTL